MPNSFFNWTVPGQGEHPRIWIKNDSSKFNHLPNVKTRIGTTHQTFWDDLQSYISNDDPMNAPFSFFETASIPEPLTSLCLSWLLDNSNNNHADRARSLHIPNIKAKKNVRATRFRSQVIYPCLRHFWRGQNLCAAEYRYR